MNSDSLAHIKEWYSSYAQPFTTGAHGLALRHKLKYDHSLRVAENAEAISHHLEWADTDVLTGVAASILHDVGRFTQLVDYGTHSDLKSIDHGELGHQVVLESGVLSILMPETSLAVSETVRYHNRRTIPSRISDYGQRILFLVRDADKLDIIDTVLEELDTDKHGLRSEITSTVDIRGGPSLEVLTAVRAGRSPALVQISTLADILLMHLAWILDMHFVPTLRLVAHRDLVGKISRSLPVNQETQQVLEMVSEFVHGRNSRQVGGS